MTDAYRQPRTVTRTLQGQATSDGAGVRLNRVIGTQTFGEFDPFLLLDEFVSDDPNDYVAGFPDHPHRGFETVTYMLAGRMRHRDNHGNDGVIGPGDIQWMTAGRGIVHSEMPEQSDGLMRGFQLWVNLPATDKLCPPRYQDIPASRVPTVALDGGARARVLAGEIDGVRGPVDGIATAPCYFDVTLRAGDSGAVPIPAGHNACIYVYEGAVSVGDSELTQGQLAVLSDGDHCALSAADSAALLVIAGRPLAEPIARYGPFVMNTRAEIEQAVADFRAGRF